MMIIETGELAENGKSRMQGIQDLDTQLDCDKIGSDAEVEAEMATL